MFKDNFELLPGTGFKALVTAAPAAYAGFEAIRSGIKYGEKVQQIESLLNNRQSIDNPYKDIENPYKNLPVATQAARMQAEQADISLANTLDTLRATGAAAGGATALAQAALKSKQGVAASIEKQEATNARLQAQGQFKTDMAKAQGESFRMRMQEARDVRDVNRMQSDADILKATQIANKRAVFNQLGQAGQALVGGIVPSKIGEPNVGSGVDVDSLTEDIGEFNRPGDSANVDPSNVLNLDNVTFEDDKPIIENVDFMDPSGTQAASVYGGIKPVSAASVVDVSPEGITTQQVNEFRRLKKAFPNMSIDELYSQTGIDPIMAASTNVIF